MHDNFLSVFAALDVFGKLPLPPLNLKRNDNPSLKFDRQEYSQSHFRFQAYKSDLFGARYVWILIGTYTHEWWSVPDPTLRCTKEEMKKAVAYTFIFNNQIFVSEDKPKEAQNKTLSGLVSICALLKRKTKGSSQMLEQTLSYRCHAFLFFCFLFSFKLHRSISRAKLLSMWSFIRICCELRTIWDQFLQRNDRVCNVFLWTFVVSINLAR